MSEITIRDVNFEDLRRVSEIVLEGGSERCQA